MVFTTRILLLTGFAGFSLLCFSFYLYSNGYFNNKGLPLVYVSSKNGTNSLSQSTSNKLEDETKTKSQQNLNTGFIHAFVASITVIVVSELGDKTFFIAAILSMRHSGLIVYLGAMGALGTMTILSALLGNIVTNFVPRIFTYFLSSILFACFGIKMLIEGYTMSPNEGAEEYEEVQQEVEKAEAKNDTESTSISGMGDNAAKGYQQQIIALRSVATTFAKFIRRHVSTVFVESFVMTFLAEWGDRSQMTTIILAATENLLGVIIGGIVGHGLCTGIAVVGGSCIAERISPKTVTLIGGVVFIAFALSAFFFRPDN